MKIKTTVRILCAALAILTALGLFGCSSSIKPIESTEEELRVIGKIAGRDVYYDEIRYLTLNFKDELETRYGEGIWDDPATAEEHRAELESLVWEQLVSDYYAVISMADYYYLGGSVAMFREEAIQNAVQEDVDAQAEECGGGAKKYRQGLDEIYMTDRLFRFYLAAEHCATELFYIMYQDLNVIKSGDDDIREFMHSGKFVRTNHVYLEGKTEENRALIARIGDGIRTAADPLSELLLQKGRYCNDFAMTTTHGSYFARYTSDYGDEYEECAFGLSVGQVSEVIETSKGYYVIMRLPVEDDYLESHFDTFKEDILGSEFNVMLDEERQKLKLELTDLGKSLDLLTITFPEGK